MFKIRICISVLMETSTYEYLVMYNCSNITTEMLSVIKYLYEKGNDPKLGTVVYIRCFHKFMGIRELCLNPKSHEYPRPSFSDFLENFQNLHPSVFDIFIVAHSGLVDFDLDSQEYLKYQNVNIWTSKEEFNTLDLSIFYHNIWYFNLNNSMKMTKTVQPEDQGIVERWKSWLKSWWKTSDTKPRT